MRGKTSGLTFFIYLEDFIPLRSCSRHAMIAVFVQRDTCVQSCVRHMRRLSIRLQSSIVSYSNRGNYTDGTPAHRHRSSDDSDSDSEVRVTTQSCRTSQPYIFASMLLDHQRLTFTAMLVHCLRLLANVYEPYQSCQVSSHWWLARSECYMAAQTCFR